MSLEPTFRPLSEGPGLDVVDPVENRHFSLFTDGPVEPTPADTDAFAFPVDSACRVTAAEIDLPYMVPVDVRTPDGDQRRSVDSPTTYALPDADHLLEFHSPIKLYLRVSGPGKIEAATDGVRFAFGDDRDVEVGARSYHSAPGETITVPDDPAALAEAVSTFPSALKTTSPERAWPTLRGHPPRIERGDELVIPEGLDPPDTGIEITVPPAFWAVNTVAPLAYYLGATVTTGEAGDVSSDDAATVTTDDGTSGPSGDAVAATTDSIAGPSSDAAAADAGVTHSLGDGPAAVADATAALLKRVFFLDCVVRTEGLYADPLHERAVLESRVDLDLAGLYDAAPAERLAAYLDVPDDAVDAISSPWHRITHVERGPGPMELLPYVVNDLSLVRPSVSDEPEPTTDEATEELDDHLDEFMRGSGEAFVPGPARAAATAPTGDFTRSAGTGPVQRRPEDGDDTSGTRGTPSVGEYVSLPEVDALQQAWVGEGTPVRGTKLLLEAFARETPEPADGTVDVTVVCNDERMRAELDSVGDIYGSRDDVRVSVTSETAVRTDDLRSLLAEDADVFHFVGHIDGHGFACPDGILDAATLEDTGATVALLNGCRSHDQGVELVEAGANAAIVSLSDLYNEGAVEVGRTVARLLHYGFDVGATMKIVREYTSLGSQYVVVGDPGVEVAECDRLFPTLYDVERQNDGETKLNVHPISFPVRQYGVGTTFKPFGLEFENYEIAVGDSEITSIDEEKFRNVISGAPEPLIVDDELVWSDVCFE